MDDYITKSAARRIMLKYGGPNTGPMLRELELEPAADVVPVVRAHWVRMSEREVMGEVNCQCSECAFDDWNTPYWWQNDAHFCPNCGADMRGPSHEGSDR